jgi:plasmid maintenance system antidote protein VapI
MGRPVQVINEIVLGKKQITGETALQLEAVLGVGAEFWMRLEADHQLSKARLALRAGTRIRPGRAAVARQPVRRQAAR